MDVDRRAFTAGLAGFMLSTAVSELAGAQQLENPSIRLGVANKAHLYYLPVTLAERRGHFRDYGLNVAITDFEGALNLLMPCSPVRSTL
jgi:NitT/TauT family transport system substrate-binding protein